MILGAAKAAIGLSLGTLCVAPAHADVLEIGDKGARWISGPDADAQQTGPISAAVPLEEVPAEAGLVPEHAVARAGDGAAAVPQLYSAKVAELSARYDLSPSLIEALVWQESRWRANAVSPAGARGLAQLMPGTARDLGVNPDDPFANLEGGARYLREQIDRFGGDLERALAAYNAGPHRVIRSGGVPDITETKNYVLAIMGRLSDQSRSSE
ncbi:Membrane-bound lytic murein transglycosylase F precursor [Croceibacterium atlanticum]|uniref:Membrane-bound lytic murein transglycosylase F n=1 Tax=Croceibacterium atlanticum TaxID=1267766 RepID=A0A0F7KYQ4_9SPHN|nr:lytic transglycosylase domain-containing protein [Croceibacterium atlanticum]AKH43940.1 Membrane-bound lytic murein transglycosylase F precursor [Croceibacterium atlanticum]